jgi:PleD family two-component response regulator
MIDDTAPNTGISKIALREMLREAMANTASLKVTRCARGASGIQENAGYAALRAERAKAADRFAVSLKPVIAEIRAKGAKTPMAIAKDLNDLRILTPKGNQWDSQSVRRLLGRQAALTGRSDGAPFGLDAGINERSSDVTAERPCKQANNINDRRGAIRPDLPNIV